MSEPKRPPIHNLLIFIAVAIGLGLVSYAFYDHVAPQIETGYGDYKAANRFMEDGAFEAALDGFNASIEKQPDWAPNYLGRGIALLKLNRMAEAEADLNAAIKLKPDFGEAYANRGILRDMLGRYQEAVADYKKAASLRPELKEGPGLLNRFFANEPGEAPTIDKRAAYLEAELAKPEGERLLRNPEEDKKSRMYTAEEGSDR